MGMCNLFVSYSAYVIGHACKNKNVSDVLYHYNQNWHKYRLDNLDYSQILASSDRIIYWQN